MSDAGDRWSESFDLGDVSRVDQSMETPQPDDGDGAALEGSRHRRWPPSWRSRPRLALAIMAILGIAAGALTGYARDQTVGPAPAPAVGIVATDISARSFGTAGAPLRFDVDLYNPDDESVEVLAAVPRGWPAGTQPAAPPIALLPGRVRPVPMNTTPDCGIGAPDQLDVRLRSGGIESNVVLSFPDPPPQTLEVVRLAACGTGLALVEIPAAAVVTENGTFVRMRLTLAARGGWGEVVVEDVQARAPGFDVVPVAGDTKLSVSGEGDHIVALDLDWSVTDCATASNLGDVYLQFDGRGGILPVDLGGLALPSRGVAALARFAAVTCG